MLCSSLGGKEIENDCTKKCFQKPQQQCKVQYFYDYEMMTMINLLTECSLCFFLIAEDYFLLFVLFYRNHSPSSFTLTLSLPSSSFSATLICFNDEFMGLPRMAFDLEIGVKLCMICSREGRRPPAPAVNPKIKVHS